MSRAAAVLIETPQSATDMPSFRAVSANAQPRLRHAEHSDVPGKNPAVALQQDLAAALAQGAFDARIAGEPGSDPAKWSPRQTIAFAFLTCSAFWGGLAWLMMKLF